MPCYLIIGRIDQSPDTLVDEPLYVRRENKCRRSTARALRCGARSAPRSSNTREAHVTRKTLERELATYTTQSDLADLHAILDRHSDHETAHIRRILARRAA